MTVKFVTWNLPYHEGSGSSSNYSMLKAVLLWDDETHRGLAAWDMSYPDMRVSTVYRDFYSRRYNSYENRVWRVILLEEL